MSSINSVLALSSDCLDILEKIKNLKSPGCCGNKFQPDLEERIKKLSPDELGNVLKRYFTEMSKQFIAQDPAKIVDKLRNFIPLDKIEIASKFNDALKEAQGMFKEAQLYLSTTDNNISPMLCSYLSALLDQIVTFIDVIVSVFGLGDFFRSTETDLQKITMLLSLFIMLVTGVLPIIGAATGGLIIGGVFLGIFALSIILPYIKPAPKSLPANAENLTLGVRKGGRKIKGRTEEISSTGDILQRQKHALWVAESRAGESLMGKAFAQALEKGDFPELAGCMVFRLNARELLDQKSGNNTLNDISNKMGRHRDKIILIIDEFHIICKNKSSLADRIKSFLERDGNFRHVIGVATKTECEKNIKPHKDFCDLFEIVDVPNASKDETLEVMADTVLTSKSKPILEGGVLEYIWQETGNSSIGVLEKCIQKTEASQETPRKKEIRKISNNLESLVSLAAAYRGPNIKKEEIKTLEGSLKSKEEELKTEKSEIDQLFQLKDLYNRVVREKHLTVLKLESVSRETFGQSEENELKSFLLLHSFFQASLKDHIKLRAKDLGVHVEINTDLVDEVLGRKKTQQDTQETPLASGLETG